jgi:hypothetical protein
MRLARTAAPLPRRSAWLEPKCNRAEEMWSAGLEPATRRVSDDRSPLSYDHAGWARLDSNQRQLDDPGVSSLRCHVRFAAERCCSCHSPALRPWIAAFGVLRGGDLEPGALATPEIRRQKRRLIQQRIQPARSAEGPFSLRRGLESKSCFLKLGITPGMGWDLVSQTTKATRWVAFAQCWMRLAC